MSETCSGITWSSGFDVASNDKAVSLGGPIPSASLKIVDEKGQTLPEGDVGQLLVAGPSVTREYLNATEANKESFQDEWLITGDLGFISKGELYITGREKEVLIINGANLHCHEIEQTVEALPDCVAQTFTAACSVRTPESQSDELAIFFVPHTHTANNSSEAAKTIRTKVAEAFGVRVSFLISVEQHEIPKTEIGKIQRLKLKKQFEQGQFSKRTLQTNQSTGSRTSDTKSPKTVGNERKLRRQITKIWEDALNTSVGPHETFFELGGHSLLIPQIQEQLEQLLEKTIRVTELFNLPTVADLARYFSDSPQTEEASIASPHRKSRSRENNVSSDIAIIGMAGRFPGASNLGAFWKNLIDGEETISVFTDDELLEAGVSPELIANPDYVKAGPVLEDADHFDASFFSISAKEARMMDPQHRVFLETCWETFEDAGYNPLTFDGRVGVYAATLLNTYLVNNLYANQEYIQKELGGRLLRVESMGGFNLMITNDKDYLPTRVAYKLNLKGPAINVQTACSSTLVAVHVACESILQGDCDMALAGGVSVSVPQKAGHLFAEGMINCPDGHCRAYDADAGGTIFGNGSGAILLKRLDQALADRDSIYAVIKGTASNNDGGSKVGFTAPSEDGEARAIAEAYRKANISPESVSFVEGHGTGTQIGDPIEVEALTKIFRQYTDKEQFCRIGSVKSNIGHMQVASGIAGMIKACLSVHHGQIPPTLHFKQPNPRLQWEQSPFLVNTTSEAWPDSDTPRRASVNSLGIGGTNAHVVIEQSPSLEKPSNGTEGPYLLTLSSRSAEGLSQLQDRYADHAAQWTDEQVPDIAYTTQVGRAHWEYRRAFVFTSSKDLRPILTSPHTAMKVNSNEANLNEVTFLFSGQGSQYHNMGQQLYASSSVFRDAIDTCDHILQTECAVSLRKILFDSSTPELIHSTENTQPALFAVEYALAQYWLQLGIDPQYLIGHSVGEYVAAVIANVFSLHDALRLVAARGKAMAKHGGEGIMLAAICSESDAQKAINEIGPEVAIAAINGPTSIVLSGAKEATARVGEALKLQGIKITQLAVSHPFHSPQMETALDAFRKVAETIQFNPPERTIISNLSGKPAGNEIATPEYWVRHIVEPVRFHESVQEAIRGGSNIMLELGPHPVLSSMIKQSFGEDSPHLIQSLRKGHDDNSTFLNGLSRCYEWGAEIDWTTIHNAEERSRCHLPHYAWQREKHWVEGADLKAETQHGSKEGSAHPMIGRAIDSPIFKGLLFDSTISADTDFARDHQVFDDVVIPAAGHLSAIIHAGSIFAGSEQITLTNLVFPRALVLDRSAPSRIQLTINGDQSEPDGSASIQIASKPNGDWIKHATATLTIGSRTEPTLPDTQIPVSLRTSANGSVHYQSMADRQIKLGPSYHWIQAGVNESNTGWVHLKAPNIDAHDWSLSAPHLHPGLIDSLLQSVVFATDIPTDATYVPYRIDSLSVYGLPPISTSELWARATIKEVIASDGKGRIRSDVTLFNSEGRALIQFDDFEIREINISDFRKDSSSSNIDEFEIRWLPGPTFSSDKKRALETNKEAVLVIRSRADKESGKALERFKQLNPLTELEEVALEDLANESITPEAQQSLNSKPWSRILYLGWLAPIHGDEPVESAPLFEANLSAIKLILTTFSQEETSAAPIWFITQLGQRIHSESTVHFTQSAVWGLVRSLQQEFPNFSLHLADCDTEAESFNHLFVDIFGLKTENEIAYRAGQRYTARLTPISPSVDSVTNQADLFPNVRSDASYIVTGGFGGLGFQTIERLLASGAQSICIVSRTDHSTKPDIATRLEQLQQGTKIEIRIVAGGIEDISVAARAVTVANEMRALKGIFHCAGVLQDGLFMDSGPETFNATFTPKVHGAWALHQASLTENLDFFVLFSSIASIIGSAGQTAYSASNAGLDGFFSYRRSQNLPCSVINWGPWEEVGMATQLTDAMQRRLSKRGLQNISPVSGMKALAQTLHPEHSDSQRILMPIHLSSFSKAYHSRSSLFDSNYFTQHSPAPQATKKASQQRLNEIQKRPKTQRVRAIRDLIQQLTGDVLGIDKDKIQTDINLLDQGLDSLMSVDLKVRMEAELGMRFSAALIYDFPNIDQLAQAIAKRLFPEKEEESPATRTVEQASEGDIEDLTEAELEAQLAAELEGESS